MIKKVEISGIHTVVTKDLEKYITGKIKTLERYIPRGARTAAHVEVMLKESKTRDKKTCTCEIIVHVPGENLAATESTVNMYAAVDIVQAKLKSQLQKYKAHHSVQTGGRKRRRVRDFLGKIRSR